MTPRPTLSEQHPDLESGIKESAWQQINEKGAAALSLRGIARSLGITAPAIYNYFPNRDALVTALIVDAYLSLAESQRRALVPLSQDDHPLRLRTLGLAYRQWALAHPGQYNLIFGTPIPNYHAPLEITGPAAGQSMFALIETIDAAYRAGKLDVVELSPELMAMVAPWVEKFGYDGHPCVIHYTVASWAQIHGLVSLELFGHFSAVDGQAATDALFTAEINATIERIGIRK